MVTLTETAVEVLVRSDAAARRLNPDARVRLGPGVAPDLRTELVEGPAEGDQVITPAEGVEVYVDGMLQGVVDVAEPHDRLVLRPPTAPPAR